MPTAPEQIGPRFEAILAAKMASDKVARESRALDLERQAEDLRAISKAQEEAEKARSKALLKGIEDKRRAAEAQAKEAGGQPVTLSEPFAPGQMQQVGSNLEQAMGRVPVAQVAGREAPVTETTVSALQNALRGIPAEQTGRVETDTTVPVRTGKGIAMVPMRTTRRTTTPTGLTQAQALQGLLGMATEQRLSDEARINDQKFRLESLGMLIGSDVSQEEIQKIPRGAEGDYYAWPPEVQKKVIARQKKMTELADRTKIQALRTDLLQAKAAGDRIETARIEKEIALIEARTSRGEEYYRDLVARSQVLNSLVNVRKLIDAGLMKSADEASFSELIGMVPPIRDAAEYQKARTALASGQNVVAKLHDAYAAEPGQVYTLQMAAAPLGLVVVRGTKGGTNLFGFPTKSGAPAFGVAEWPTVFEAMYFAEGNRPPGMSDADFKEGSRSAEARLKEWELISRVDETQGNRLVPVTEGNMSSVSEKVVKTYYALKDLSEEKGIPLLRTGSLDIPIPEEAMDVDRKIHEIIRTMRIAP